jgi:hypothetical protein
MQSAFRLGRVAGIDVALRIALAGPAVTLLQRVAGAPAARNGPALAMPSAARLATGAGWS